jgi:hypothetical protein
MNMQVWCNNWQENPQVLGEKPAPCRFTVQNSHIYCPGIDPGLADDFPLSNIHI